MPKGSLLFRQGDIMPEYGAFFALCRDWARNFKVGNPDKVSIYEVEEDIKLLFMVSHLNNVGFPITAIEDVYDLLIGGRRNLNDLDIKWKNKSAKTKFVEALEGEDITGWLSTQENTPPLEIFLMPQNIKKIVSRNELLIHEHYNTLSYLKVFAPGAFVTKSLNNMKPNIEYLLDEERRSEKDLYSLFEKLFVETNLLMAG